MSSVGTVDIEDRVRGRDVNSQGSIGGRPAATSRPPLPRLRSLPTSRASSREGSPRSMISEAPSLATQAMAKIANYRAGPRTFKPDTSARHGLATGDVVAFRTRGVFLAATPVGHQGSEPDAVLHILAPSDMVDPADRVTHMEVIRQGQWVGFRCEASGDRLLQARRRGVHRLAFFSCNLGTWEQWEMPEASALDAVPWGTATVTLRNRRMPSCELVAELVRVGTAKLMPHTALTPRSLAGPVFTEEDPQENENIRRMSGLMVHEWLNFVEREKKLRAVLEARVEQAVDDATGLREWAASQVEGVRRGVEEEVEVLLSALSNKDAALEDVQARLTTRLRWGVALLEAKKAAVLGRRVLLAWRTRAARAKYCKNVVNKLQERSCIRAGTRALQAWSDHCLEQRERRQRLRLAVRQMALLKMQTVLGSWRRIVRDWIEEAEAESTAQSIADATLRAWRLRRLTSGWRERSRRANEASRVLCGMATRTAGRLVDDAFMAWRRRVSDQKCALAGLEEKAARSYRRAQLQTALDSWRVSVEDTFGGRMQVMHAVRVMSRQRGVRALHVWRSSVITAKANAQRWRQVENIDRRRYMAKAIASWREFSFEKRGNRDVFVGFVHGRAERRMHMALAFWRAEAYRNRRAEAIVQHSAHRSAVNAVLSTFSAWRTAAAESKVSKHRIAVCARRRRANTLRCVLAAWKEVAQEEIEERHIVATFRRQTTQRRGVAALYALRSNAAQAIELRDMEATAEGWHAGRLQARALWALEEAAQRHAEFEDSLRSVAAAVDRADLKSAWEVWQQATGQAKALRQAVGKFQRRRAWFSAKSAFGAWRAARADIAAEKVLLARGVTRIAEARMRWTISAWRGMVETEANDRQAAEHGSRRLARMSLTSAFQGWRQQTQRIANLTDDLEQARQEEKSLLLINALNAWARGASLCIEQRDGMLNMLQHRAKVLQLESFQAWRERAQEWKAQQILLEKAVDKLTRLRMGQCMGAWRQQTDDGAGEAVRLSSVGLILSDRFQRSTAKRLFSAWRGRTTEIKASLQAYDARRVAQAAVTVRFAFVSWRNLKVAMEDHRERGVLGALQRADSALLVKSFIGWRHVNHMSSRNSLVMLHCVERAALHAMRVGFDRWRQAAHARRVRRTALVRFMQRANKSRQASAFQALRDFSAERVSTREELERCLVRKRISYRLFRQSYWESFDEDLQATLSAMFAMDADLEGDMQGEMGHYQRNGEVPMAAGEWPLMARVPTPSPVKSLLSSPVRKELEKLRHEQAVSTEEGAYSARDELSARVQAALASAEASPVSALPPPADGLGSDVLAPLLHMFGGGGSTSAASFSESGYPPLSPVAEARESTLGDYEYEVEKMSHLSASPATRSPPSSQASSVAPTAISTPPRAATPGGGTTPYTSLSRFNTPGSQLKQNEARRSATVGGGIFAGLDTAAFLADQPTPGLTSTATAAAAAGFTLPRSTPVTCVAPGTVFRTPLTDYQTLGPSAALTGDYKMRSISAAAFNFGSGGDPGRTASLSSSGTPPLHDNPLAALMESPGKENFV